MDFTHKSRWVKDFNCTPDRTTLSYASVVSHDSIRIAMSYSEIMVLGVLAYGISNAYLQAPTIETNDGICGFEFGIYNVGKVALITRALYSIKVSVQNLFHHLRICMDYFGFTSSLVDTDMWICEPTKSNG